MKKTSLLVASLSLLCLVLPTSALAQKAGGPKAKLMAKYDLNKNGVIDGDEIATVRKDFAADPTGELKRFDTNKDGKLSDEEIAQMKPPGGKSGADTKKKGGTKKEKSAAAVTAPTPAPETPKEKTP
jgi:hypothetical protein